MDTIRTIRSRKDAEAIADQMAEQMVVGETWWLNALDITFMGYHRFSVQNGPHSRAVFWTGELADLLWDNRKHVNDWLRVQYNA